MPLFKGKATLVQLQCLVWLSVMLISFFAMVPLDGYGLSAMSAVLSASFYSIIVYGNINFLYPTFYQKKRYTLYVTGAIMLLLLAGICKGYVSAFINSYYFGQPPKVINVKMLFTFFISGFTVFVLSFIFRLAMAYFALKQHAEEILLQRSQFELTLLKSQVQPHFLFNTLNNIYYEVYREAPHAAQLIEKLSDMMRYFVDESTGDTVLLATEIQFLENYIALERIRIRHKTEINFVKQFDTELRLPPMLLMTFVENIFKHGIDKTSTENKIDISVEYSGGYLRFNTKNKVYAQQAGTKPNGIGLQNLRKRLGILYGNNFELNTANDGCFFTAFLKVPI